jgi:hypothetical protein
MLKETQGQQLLANHQILYDLLVKIPRSRPIKYREEKMGEKWIAKPRFSPRIYQWDPTLLSKIKDHLQQIWDYFSTYSFWFDGSLYPLIAWDDRRCSKKSIIFLLERDVWETDEVFGDYLIEEKEGCMSLSYYRFDQKYKTHHTPLMDENERNEWVCMDAQNQIINQFVYLWERLAIEIQSCVNETFSKGVRILLNSDELKLRFAQIADFYPKYPEVALLSLGWIAEQCLLLLLDLPEKGIYDDLIRLAEVKEIISPKIGKFFRLVRGQYNKLKHKAYYRVDPQVLKAIIEQFRELVNDHGGLSKKSTTNGRI